MKKITLLVLFVLAFQNFSAQTVNIPDEYLKSLLLNYSPVIDTNNDNEIQVSEALQVTELDVQFQSSWAPTISDATGLEAFINLTNLNLRGNVLTDIDLTSLVNLEVLNLNDNNIGTVDISQNSNLQIFRIRNNNLTSINLDHPDLLELEISGNNLTTLDITGELNLELLSASGNNIAAIDLSQNLNLEEIFLSANPITNLDVSNNMYLEYLWIESNLITELDLSQNPNLIEVSFFDSEFLVYVNLKNGNSSNIGLGEGFYETPNVELVCVDEIDTFNTWYFQQLEVLNATLSTNCNFGNDQPNVVYGSVKYDIGLGCNDPSAVIVPNTLVTANVNGEDYGTITDANGDYTLYTDEGNNTLTALSANMNFTFTPASQQVNFTGYGNQTTIDFCAEAATTINDLSVAFLPINNARPGFSSNYQIVVTNNGTTSLDGEILLTYDENLQTFIVASPSETATTTNTISFSFTGLDPFQSDYINLQFLNAQPPTLNGGDSLDFNIEITTSVIDDNPSDNEFTYSQEVVNSFDPNDKSVLEGSEVYIEEAINYLHYMVRFQNTGTANAQKVVVKDTLSDNLDWSSLQMVSASDDYQVNIVNGNALEFVFDNIDLPFEDADEEGSQGYISYKIKPKQGIVVGDIIAGDAAIYFDFNEPIITNEVSTEIIENLSVAAKELSSRIQLYPNPTEHVMYIENNSSERIDQVGVYTITGQQILVENKAQQINLSSLNTGIYFVKITTEGGISFTQKVIKK